MDCHATASAVSRNDRNNAPILKTPAKDSRIFDTNAASEKVDSRDNAQNVRLRKGF